MLLNRERALAIMKESGIDALIATQPENVAYMTGYNSWEMPGSWSYRGITLEKGMQNYAMLTPDGARTLICFAMGELSKIATYGVPVENLYVYGRTFVNRPASFEPQREDERLFLEYFDSKTNRTLDAVSALIKALKDQGINRGRIAIEQANLAPSAEEQLRAECSQVEFIDAGKVLARIRYVKTPEEIERLRRAAQMNERAIQEMIDALRPGVTELEMLQVYRLAVARDGGSIDFLTCAGGLRGGMWAPPSGYRFKPGDPFIIDTGCALDLYHADTGLCGALGEPPKRLRELWKGLSEVWDVGISMFRPGVRPSEAFDAMAAVQQRIFGFVAGYFGHSIGIELREYPTVNKVPGAGTKLMDLQDDPPFEVGMVMLLEPEMAELGCGAVQREETFIITERGCEPLIHTMRDLHILSS